MNKTKENLSKYLLGINNLSFKGSFVLALLFMAGLLLKYSLKYMEISEFWVDVISILSNAFITASILDFLLSISNERQTIKEFSKGVYDYIDMLWANDYFPSRLSQPLSILISENVAGDSGTSNEKLQERFHGYINSLTKYAGICTEQLVYIHDFDRKVTIFNSKKTGYIEVHTVTDITYVNLRDTSYYAEHTPQFRKSDGSGKSYRIVQVKVNGKDKTKEAQDQLKGAELKPVYEDSVFESGKKYVEEIPAHQTKRIWSKTIYEIPVGMLFQSKVFVLPCMNFELTAEVDPKCIEHFPGKNPIFRWTLFETEATRPEDAFKEQKSHIEGNNGMLYLSGTFMKPGSGYALTLCFIYDRQS